ncbi:MAG: hypothetical protein ABIN37_03905 [Burkholderiaceae bacterium]
MPADRGYCRAHSVMMPPLDALRSKDAILFGTAGDPREYGL